MNARAAIPIRYRAAEARAKAALAPVVVKVVTYQATYFARHGRYLQLLPSHAQTPSETTPTPADRTRRAPRDRRSRVFDGMDGETPVYRTVEDDTWADTGITLPDACSVAVSDYSGPKGHGFVVVAEIKVGADTVVVERPFGPERYRRNATRVNRAAL